MILAVLWPLAVVAGWVGNRQKTGGEQASQLPRQIWASSVAVTLTHTLPATDRQARWN